MASRDSRPGTADDQFQGCGYGTGDILRGGTECRDRPRRTSELLEIEIEGLEWKAPLSWIASGLWTKFALGQGSPDRRRQAG